MKKLLTKFKLSNALDENAGEPVPESLREKISACPELRDFAQRAAGLDRALRHPPAVPASDATLHQSIMRAVRAGTAAPAPTRVPVRIGLAAAFAALAAMGIWLAARPAGSALPTAKSGEQTLAAAQRVLDMGGEISRSMPGAVVAPLSDELACVDHDIRDTTKFVLAVLP
jgi:hypothetical protein